MDIVRQVASSLSRYAFGTWTGRNLEAAIDFDDVLFDYKGRYCYICQEGGFGDVSDYFTRFGKVYRIPPEIREYVNSREDFYTPEWILPDAIESLERLRENNVNPFIVTASFRRQTNSKLWLIDKTFGPYYEERIFITRDKSRVLCDILFDDALLNIQRYNASKMGLGILAALDHRVSEPVPTELENTCIDGIKELPDFIEALKQFII